MVHFINKRIVCRSERVAKTQKKICLIVNPFAGRGIDEKSKLLFAEAIRKVGGYVVFTESKGKNTTARLARRAQKKGFNRIIVAGGDGTISQAVQGLSLPDPSISLGIVPIGSANDLAIALNLPKEKNNALNLAINGQETTAIDLGMVNRRPYVSVFSIGFDAKINQSAFIIRSQLKKIPFSRRMFFLWRAPFVVAFFYQLSRCIPCSKVVFQGDIIKQVPTVLLSVNNIPVFAGGFKITPEAKINDGLLDACLITAPINRMEMISLTFEAISGRHIKFRHVSMHQIKRLIIESKETLAAEIDGEPIDPATRFEISVFPKALNVVVPPSLS